MPPGCYKIYGHGEGCRFQWYRTAYTGDAARDELHRARRAFPFTNFTVLYYSYLDGTAKPAMAHLAPSP